MNVPIRCNHKICDYNILSNVNRLRPYRNMTSPILSFNKTGVYYRGVEAYNT